MRKQLREMIFFFDRLGDAFKSTPGIGKHRKSRLKLILVLFWKDVFSKLTYKEQVDVLNKAGFEIVDDNLFRKLVRKEIKPIFE